MTATIVLGAQWGDEGKGKLVDVLAARADVVVRFQGGANAGHTVWNDQGKIVLHLLPSGVLHPHTQNVVATGCVVDPITMADEIAEILAKKITLEAGRLLVSRRAHMITPIHRAVDRLTGAAIGTTGRGIGPAYGDRVLRRGIRLGDALGPELGPLLGAQRDAWSCATGCSTADLPEVDRCLEELAPALDVLRPYLADTEDAIATAWREGRRILYEGAQGALLDIDHGTYPFVTSSSTSIGGAYTGGGVFLDFTRRIGVCKAYTTRVGNGPFPTEIHGPLGEALRERGHEYGATTGRPRRCGWLDLHLVAQAARTSGYTELALTKLDCLSESDPIRVATGRDDAGMPVYRDLPGWKGSIADAADFSHLPPAARAYIAFIEEQTGIPVTMVSTGPYRNELIEKETT
jgi:adenylosuccinate synthase